MNEAPLDEAGHDVDKLHVRERNTLAPPSAAATRWLPHDDRVSLADSGTVIHPCPAGASTVPPVGLTVPSRVLWELLHLDRAKAISQSPDGRYPGRRRRFTVAELELHLSGEPTLALAPLAGKRALFIVLDFDKLFPAFLPLVRDYVCKIGGHELARACFITDGSDEGRGKVIFCLAEPARSLEARWLAQRLLRSVRASELAGSLGPGDISAYPQERTGGVVRVLGRNPSRAGPIELAYSLDGEPGLSHVQPLSKTKLATIVSHLPPRQTWAERFIETPWRSAEGTDRHYRRMGALARDAIRRCGPKKGRLEWDEWLQRIKANSPELGLPSKKNGDRRNILDHGRERAWKFAADNPISWSPLILSIRHYPRGVVRFYNVAVKIVQFHGLSPTVFGVDYERIATELGSSKSTAHRLARRSEEYGVLVIHDPGLPDTKGNHGLTALLGIVCRGETVEKVRAAGAATERVRQRKAERERRAAL